MSDLFAVGTNKNEPFCVTLNAEETLKLINNAINGEDEALNKKLGTMVNVERKVVDAMTWDEEYFLKQTIIIIKRHGRFAVKHKDLSFGVSTNWEQAKTAFDNKEF